MIFTIIEVIAVPVALGLLGWWLKFQWDILGAAGTPSFKTRIIRLRSRNYPHYYKNTLSRTLDKVDHWFGETSAQPEAPLITHIRSALTSSSFEKILLIAIFYPTALFIVQWLITNHGSLGGVTIIEAVSTLQNNLTRLLLIIMFIGCLMWKWYFADIIGDKPFVRMMSAVGIICLFVFYVDLSLSRSFVPTVTLFIFSVGITYAAKDFAMLSSRFINIAASRSDLTVSPFSGSGVAIYLASFILILSFLHVSDQGPNFLLVMIGTLMVSTLVIGISFEIKYLGMAVRYLYVLGLLYAVHYLLLQTQDQSPFLYPAIYLALLPLLNAPFDWVSTAMTRSLLRSIATGNHGIARSYLWGFLDLILALALLIGLAITTWSVVDYLSEGTGSIINSQAILDQFRTGYWKDNLWIWMMFGSTLLPTAFHFLVAMLALLLKFNHKKSRLAARQLQRARKKALEYSNNPEAAQAVPVDPDARWTAFVRLTLVPALVFVVWLVIVGVTGYLFLFHLPYIIQSIV